LLPVVEYSRHALIAILILLDAITKLKPIMSYRFTLPTLICSVLFASFISTAAFSQVTFQIAFGGTGYDVSHMMMQVTSNGTYITTGETYSFGAGSDDMYAAEISATGAVMWSKTYGTSASERSHCVRQTFDGGYIISGFKYVSGNGSDACLVKTDPAGNLSWVRTYGGPMSEEFYSVRQTSDRGFIAVGFTANYTSTLNLEMYAVKTDVYGNVIWTKTYGVSGFLGDEANDVLEAADSNYVIMGKTSTPGLYDVALLKIDRTDGSIIWSKKYNFYSYDNAETFKRTSDDGFIICGYASTGANEDIMLLKTDADGVVQWSKTYGDAYSNRGWGVTQTTDGGFAVTGSWHAAALTGEDMYIMKTDVSGALQFIKTLGSTKDDLGYIIEQTADGGFVVSGITCCGSVGPGDRDFMLSKTDQQGNIFGTCNLISPAVTITNPGVVEVPITMFENTFGSTSSPSLTVTAPPTQNVVICSNLPLPIELLSFEAQQSGSGVLLKWQTASEINNDYFVVERSRNGEHFERVGDVDGHGNSTSTLYYSLLDERPYKGISYYRLKQTDFDGHSTFSKAVAVKMDAVTDFYPNPAGDELFITGMSGENEEITITDISGKEVLKSAVSPQYASVNVQSLKDGLYYVKLHAENHSPVSKLIISRNR
jgi:hypothetical protein